MLGLGALFLSMSDQYAPEIYSLLFGEVLGVSASEVAPVAVIGAVCVAAIIVMYRPLLLSSVLPELAEARGVRAHRIETCASWWSSPWPPAWRCRSSARC